MAVTINIDLVKKVFILEDDENRIAWFQDKFAYAQAFFVTKQTGTAIEVLNQLKFDLIFLDHDLEPSHYSDFAEGREPQMELTGLYVAKNLKDTLNVDTPVIIHSMNPVGSQKMNQELPNAIQEPFHLLMEGAKFVHGNQ